MVARFVQLELEEKEQRMKSSRRVLVIDTACAAFRRDAFLEAGAIDEEFALPSVEDVDLSFRLVSKWRQMVYAPRARVRDHYEDRL